MSKKDSYGFTIDIENLVRICLQDPATKEMVFNGIRKGPMEHTTPLGAANMKENKSDPDSWYTVFLGTSTQVKPGQEGFVNRNTNGQGPRISIRLKRQQSKTHAATQTAAVPQTPGQVLPTSADDTAELLKRALDGDKKAAEAILKLTEPAVEEDINLPPMHYTL